ncbi:MAG TPA: hypothetical protein VHD90_13205 [Phototrophicaceae bacterium]|nr:hypothetical protein [Phototrophicaceae bacterium]
MQISAEQAMSGYADAYQKLYKRMPKDLRALDGNWVVVNGARIQASELQLLTTRLQQEYKQAQDQKRSLVNRLVKWFKS